MSLGLLGPWLPGRMSPLSAAARGGFSSGKKGAEPAEYSFDWLPEEAILVRL